MIRFFFSKLWRTYFFEKKKSLLDEQTLVAKIFRGVDTYVRDVHFCQKSAFYSGCIFLCIQYMYIMSSTQNTEQHIPLYSIFLETVIVPSTITSFPSQQRMIISFPGRPPPLQQCPEQDPDWAISEGRRVQDLVVYYAQCPRPLLRNRCR